MTASHAVEAVVIAATLAATTACVSTDLRATGEHPANPAAPRAGVELPPTLSDGFDPYEAYPEESSGGAHAGHGAHTGHGAHAGHGKKPALAADAGTADADPHAGHGATP